MERSQTTFNKLTATLSVGLAITALTACAESTKLDRSRSATVVSHDHDPYMLISVKPLIVQPEDWDIVVQQCGFVHEYDADADGCINLEIDVTPAEYKMIKDGQELTPQELDVLLNR